jgi:hypothetical protein
VTPCSLTIFTLGVLVLAVERVPLRLLVVPVLWSGIGLVAAVQLGVPADYGLAEAPGAPSAARACERPGGPDPPAPPLCRRSR